MNALFKNRFSHRPRFLILRLPTDCSCFYNALHVRPIKQKLIKINLLLHATPSQLFANSAGSELVCFFSLNYLLFVCLQVVRRFKSTQNGTKCGIQTWMIWHERKPWAKITPLRTLRCNWAPQRTCIVTLEVAQIGQYQAER